MHTTTSQISAVVPPGGIVLRWTLMTLIGVILGIGLMAAIIHYTKDTFSSTSIEGDFVNVLMQRGLVGLALGLMVGVVQGEVVRLLLPGIGFWRWVAASAVGGLLSVIICLQVLDLFNVQNLDIDITLAIWAFVPGILFGIPFTLSQFFVLRRSARNAWVWPLIASLAWSLGLMAATFVLITLFNLYPTSMAPEDSVLHIAAFVLTLGLVVGLISSAAMVLVVRRTVVAEHPLGMNV